MNEIEFVQKMGPFIRSSEIQVKQFILSVMKQGEALGLPGDVCMMIVSLCMKPYAQVLEQIVAKDFAQMPEFPELMKQVNLELYKEAEKMVADFQKFREKSHEPK